MGLRLISTLSSPYFVGWIPTISQYSGWNHNSWVYSSNKSHRVPNEVKRGWVVRWKWPWRVAMRDEVDLDLMLVLRRKLFKVWRRNPSDLHKSQFSPKVQRRKFNMELNKGYYHLLDLILFPAGLKIASISPLSVAVFAHAFPLPGKRQLARQNCRARLWHVGFNQPKLVGLRLKLRKKASRSYIYIHTYTYIYIYVYIYMFVYSKVIYIIHRIS
jgi:hypothetical protein